jgi:hypothetical protein
LKHAQIGNPIDQSLIFAILIVLIAITLCVYSERAVFAPYIPSTCGAQFGA